MRVDTITNNACSYAFLYNILVSFTKNLLHVAAVIPNENRYQKHEV